MDKTESANQAGDFDTRELLGELKILRAETRTKVWNFLLWWTLPLLAVSLILLIVGIWVPVCLRASLGVGVLWLAASIAALFFPHWRLTRYFKHRTLPGLCRLIDPDLRFVPDSGIAAADYRTSGIFPAQYDRFSGKNLFTGTHSGVPLSFSELHTQYRTVTRSEKHRRQTSWHTIFQGVFFQAELPVRLAGRVFIFSESAEQAEKRLAGESLKQLFSASRGQMFDPGDADFSGSFSVYAENADTARMLLDTGRKSALLALRTRLPGKIHFSFFENTLYLAAESADGLLNLPRRLAKVTEDDLTRTLERARLFAGIVDDLKLNHMTARDL